MATGGRVVHHLQHLLPDPRHTVVLTGYQAVGTRGRQLAEGATELKMYGGYVPVRAEVVVDDGFSVHADATELLAWLQELPTAPETVYIVLGEPESSRSMAAMVRAETGWCVVVARLGEKVRTRLSDPPFQLLVSTTFNSPDRLPLELGGEHPSGRG